MLSCLLYADDLLLLAPLAENLQHLRLINVVAEWCTHWKMFRNLGKANIVHFHNIMQHTI